MSIRTCLLLFFLCCLACKTGEKKTDSGTATQMQFDKVKWSERDDKDYPYRDKMIRDLLDNGKLKGLKHDEVINMLGQPDRNDTGYLFYRVAQTRIGSFPLHTKSLVIKLPRDSMVQWVKIHE